MRELSLDERDFGLPRLGDRERCLLGFTPEVPLADTPALAFGFFRWFRRGWRWLLFGFEELAALLVGEFFDRESSLFSSFFSCCWRLFVFAEVAFSMSEAMTGVSMVGSSSRIVLASSVASS